MSKKFTINLLFHDGVVSLKVEPPESIKDEDFAAWTVGVNSGIAAYLKATTIDHNFKKEGVEESL